MIYKGYAAKIEYSDEDQCLIGHIAGISDVTDFHADSVSELLTAFEKTIDDYLTYYAEHGLSPQRTASGKISLRIPSPILTNP
ncbi:type II toxin-antitoxin system HicB family antitoxin [Photorhabdus sp. RW14-46]|uniref:type II toxin-antitoxin system HicB family antitoxin n=1 Tax=Photorhabdus sp. RW14-46 TaxID=2100168 RepID=UPI0013F4B9CC|nr:type II toxin-antitoxin system HicB family antitoxin [Photorhabdus sp. RW14-46]NHB60680.1 toxin-antitoxin system HicB family antitoxin [Photorhabdus sp. RW14-46]